MLAKMGVTLELTTRSARSDLLFELKERYLAREALMKDHTAAKNRAKALTVSLLKRHNAQRLEQIERQRFDPIGKGSCAQGVKISPTPVTARPQSGGR